MPLPRYRLLLAALAPLLAAMLIPIRVEVNANFWDSLMDAAHVPVFAAATWLFFAANPLGLVRRRDAWLAALGLAAAAAAAIELLQGYTGRSGNLPDLGHGALGIAVAGAALARRPLLTAATALAATILMLATPLAEARSIAWRNRHFPLLGDFESDAELRLWLANDRDYLTSGAPRARTTAQATHGTHSLRVPIRLTNWPGVRLLCGDRDWSSYQSLAFDLHNDGAAFTLALRIDDTRSTSHANRFNTGLPMAPGPNRVRLSLEEVGRAIDLRAVRRVVFFEAEPRAEHTWFLDHVRLE